MTRPDIGDISRGLHVCDPLWWTSCSGGGCQKRSIAQGTARFMYKSCMLWYSAQLHCTLTPAIYTPATGIPRRVWTVCDARERAGLGLQDNHGLYDLACLLGRWSIKPGRAIIKRCATFIFSAGHQADRVNNSPGKLPQHFGTMVGETERDLKYMARV